MTAGNGTRVQAKRDSRTVLEILFELSGIFWESINFFFVQLVVRLRDQIIQNPLQLPLQVIIAVELALIDSTGNFSTGVRRMAERALLMAFFPPGLKSKVMTQQQFATALYDFILKNTVEVALNPDSFITLAARWKHRVGQMKWWRYVRQFKWLEILVSRAQGLVVAFVIIFFKSWIVTMGLLLMIKARDLVEFGLPSLQQNNPIVKDQTLGRKRQRR